jgi:oligopeptidase B
MKYNFNSALFLIFISIIIFAACKNEAPKENLTSMYQKMDTPAPVAEIQPKELTNHGVTRLDNYYWLNQRTDSKVIDYLNAENKYKDAVMSHLNGLQDELFEEIKGRIKQKDETVPQLDNGYWYYNRFEEGQEYTIYCRKKGSLDAKEEILLDVNVLAKPYDYYNAFVLGVSPDNKIMAWADDTLSRRIYTVKFKNLETGEDLADFLPNTSADLVWANAIRPFSMALKTKHLGSSKS